ncbi:MAG: LacI family DNA-binding transcriptional regulator [Clostridia bacterium]|nr:LacI family DNA-binding transcriptional regulator [Clostridia bacterium]
MVTLKDIAAACGVSASTVSRALNGVETIKPDRANMIRAAAQHMGYTPNAVARALKTNRSWMIGVLYEGRITHPYFSLLIDAIRSSAEEEGFDLIFLSRSQQNGGMDYPNHALCRHMDGVVILYANVDADGVQRLLNGSIPVVSVDDCDRDCDVVMSDYRLGTRALVRSAVEKGHRRIAFVHGQMGYMTRQRLIGFREEMAANGLAVPEDFVRAAEFVNGERSAEAVRRLLALPHPPTCVLLPDDLSLLSAMRILRSEGIRVPQDVSCIGYDGIPLGQAASPRLTTYQQDVQALGEAVIQTILNAINDGAAHQTAARLIRGRLIPGETLGNPPII